MVLRHNVIKEKTIGLHYYIPRSHLFGLTERMVPAVIYLPNSFAVWAVSLQGCHSSTCPSTNNYISTSDQNQPGTHSCSLKPMGTTCWVSLQKQCFCLPKKTLFWETTWPASNSKLYQILWENTSWPRATTLWTVELNSMGQPAPAQLNLILQTVGGGHPLLAVSPFLLSSWYRVLSSAESNYKAYQRKKDAFLFHLPCLAHLNTRKNVLYLNYFYISLWTGLQHLRSAGCVSGLMLGSSSCSIWLRQVLVYLLVCVIKRLSECQWSTSGWCRKEYFFLIQ